MTKREDAVVICARLTTPLMMPDNRIGKCNECGWRVQFRPHAPRGRRMCMQCARDLLTADDFANAEIPSRMVDDLVSYYRKKAQ